MSNRQRGNITIFLVVFILLWLIFSGLCWLTFTRADNAKNALLKKEKELKSATASLNETMDRLARISNLVGFHKPINQGGQLYSDPETIIFTLDTICAEENALHSKTSLGLRKYIENQQIDKDGLIIKKNTEEIQEKKNRLLEKLLEIDTVKNLINLEDVVWKACAKRTEDLQNETRNARETLEKEKKEYEEFSLETTKEIEKLQAEVKKRHSEIEELSKEYDQKIAKIDQERNAAQEAKIEEKNKYAAMVRKERFQKNKYESEVENLNDRINELQAEAAGQIEVAQETKKEETKLQETPDGEIIYVDEKSQTAYIDLGRPEGVLKGMAFQVFRYGKGGTQIEKGKIVVRQVEESMSKVGIVEINDELSPIAIGDKIINRVYDRNKVKYFAIAGKLSQKYSLDQVVQLVKNIGGKIEQEITAKTDIVVLGEGFKNDPIYQVAVERGIETMLESEFLSYLGD